MIQRVSELTSGPIVGKYYLVPCVQTFNGLWWPIIGPKHEDAEYINFPHQHYHYDLRFFGARQLTYTQANNYKSLRDKGVRYALLMIALEGKLKDGITEKRLRCKRPMPSFPIAHPVTAQQTTWFPKLEEAYKDKKLTCLRCPHRGLPLNGLPVKDGKVICPGHGLQFNIETGELVSRLTSQSVESQHREIL